MRESIITLHRLGLRTAVALAVALAVVASQAAAQAAAPAGALTGAQGAARLDLGGDLTVGGDAERYLRALQLAGFLPAQPWTIRPVYGASATASLRDGDHPWRSRWEGDSSARRSAWKVLRPGARAIFNSAFPVQGSDGPAWAGRGMTAVVQGGFLVESGRFRLQVAPIAFVSQNQAFPLAPNGLTGDAAFRDARFPATIDAPQRFGSRAYGRLDPGNSTASFDAGKVMLGVSTAAQSWGPAQDFPLLLSASSGGFLHAFAATRSPINLGIVDLHARLIAGKLTQSDFSPKRAAPFNRWASAIALVFLPHGADGLELGITRFIEGPSERGIPTPARILRLFSTGLSGKAQLTGLNEASENQLASVFARWAFPRAGVEVYGEYLREDYSFDLRRFLQYPDDYGSYVLGLQRILLSTPGALHVLRVEVMNAELSSSNRGERGDLVNHVLHAPQPPYVHSVEVQGHTNGGLFLGSPEAYGGAGWRVSLERYNARGRVSFSLERSLRLDWLPGLADSVGVHPDVQWGVRAEALRFAGERDYTFSIEPMVDLNRNLRSGDDVFNIRLTASVRGLR